MPVRALIFDFDGLILDTETPEVEVWRAIYAEHGFEYSKDHWSQIIGGWGNSPFDPADALQQLSTLPLDLEAIRKRQREESNARVLKQPVMEGVFDYVRSARALGLRLAIASSSERDWVEPHLARLGLLNDFEKIICGDQVAPGRTKPHADLYEKALAALRLKPDEVLVLEDSPNGVKAARAAGIVFVVAVPNPITAMLPMDGADLVLDSLASLPLEGLLQRVAAQKTGGVSRPLAGPQSLA